MLLFKAKTGVPETVSVVITNLNETTFLVGATGWGRKLVTDALVYLREVLKLAIKITSNDHSAR